MSYQRALTMCEHVTSLGSESIQITAMLGVMKLILAYLIDVVKAIILIILLTFISASLIPTRTTVSAAASMITIVQSHS
jgi:hypothetical protein